MSRSLFPVLAALFLFSFGFQLHAQALSTSTYYRILAREGAEADIAFAQRWMDAAEQLMAAKYRIVPDRYRMTVALLAEPDNDINTTVSGQNRCCAIDREGWKTGTIFLLGPSAAIWKERPLLSSLGLPKEGEDYHAKVLMSEYIPIGHQAVQDRRPSGGWSYYSAPQWFVQGLQEYDAIYHTTETNRTTTAARLMTWARQNETQFACCAKGIELGDPYNGGAAFMAFLAAEFGEGIHERILRNGATTFDEALASETKPRSQAELLSSFRTWVAESK
jgi:hypothetical protein